MRPAIDVAREICGCAYPAQRQRDVALIEADREQARLEGIRMGLEAASVGIEALRYRINNPPLPEDDRKRLVRLRKMVAEFGPDGAVPSIMRPFLLPWREEWKAELADLEQRAARASQSDVEAQP